MSIMRIIGIVLLIAGVAVMVFGIYNLVSFNTSRGGRIANRAARAFGGQTETVRNSVIQIIVGVAAAGVGFVIFRKS